MHRLVNSGLAWDGGTSKRIAILIITFVIAVSLLLTAITPTAASAAGDLDDGRETVATADSPFGGGYFAPAGSFSYRGVSWS